MSWPGVRRLRRFCGNRLGRNFDYTSFLVKPLNSNENLQERGVPVKYVLFPDEGHGWGKVENRVTSDVEIVRWFEEHL
jgi:hypothetical protein